MAEENFEFGREQQGACGLCPFMLLPKDTLAKLLRPPLRKRHPIIFWTMALFAFLLLLAFLYSLGEDEDGGGDRVALVDITGPIMDARPILAWIRKIGNNSNVKGILVRVDSPGGGAAASQEIYGALERLAQKLPVAVSMGATAASGGLMVSMAGQRVFANPSTVTGSIGVRMDIPQLQGLMQKIGIGQETLVTAPFKDAASMLRPLTAEDRAYLEKVLMNMHQQFVEIVARGRKMPVEQAARLANGKICTGQEAQALGLVDALGGEDDALAWLAEKTGVPASRKPLTRTVSKTRLLERLLAISSALGLDFAGILNLETGAAGLTQPAFLY